MTIAFKKIFNVILAHDFYVDGITPDFSVKPTQRTSRLLKNQRMLFREDKTGFRVMYRTEEGSTNPFIPFDGMRLQFALTSKNNAEIQNITNLNDTSNNQDFQSGNLVHFTNEGDENLNQLDYSIINALQPPVFTYVFPQEASSPTDTGSIKVFDQDGNEVTPSTPDPNNITPDSDGRFTYPIDFSSLEPGLFKFETDVEGTIATEFIFINRELALEGAFGIVTVTLSGSSTFPFGIEYTAQFIRRETVWRYLIVLKTDTISPSDDVELNDTGTDLDPPYKSTEYIFDHKGTTTVNGLHAFIFESVVSAGGGPQKIPFFQRPKKGIEFERTSPNPKVMVENISNPEINIVTSQSATENETSVIYVFV